jgi:hypothetical protein
MPTAEQDKFQSAIAEQLTSMKRSTFAGDVALKLDLATTRRTAPQAHTIAKNRPGINAVSCSGFSPVCPSFLLRTAMRPDGLACCGQNLPHR